MSRPTDTGMNRTGLAVAPNQARALLDRLEQGREALIPDAEPQELAQARRAHAKEAEVIGSVPPPSTMKGMATAAREMIRGHKAGVFVDKLGERMAFERGGVRLYDAVLSKFDALGSWSGGPTRTELEQIRAEELRHLHLVHEAVIDLGADPTAMTPSADIVGVEVTGVLQTVSDPRTSLATSLHAILIAERADIDGWSILIELVESVGDTALAERFRDAHQREERHAGTVKSWLATSVRRDLERELSQQQKPSRSS